MNWREQLPPTNRYLEDWAKASTLCLLKAILEPAVTDGRITATAGLLAPPIPHRERHPYLTAAEVTALAEAVEEQGGMVAILGFTGLDEPRHTYASFARSADADLRYTHKTVRHFSLTATAIIFADLYYRELDAVADYLDRLSNRTG